MIVIPTALISVVSTGACLETALRLAEEAAQCLEAYNGGDEAKYNDFYAAHVAFMEYTGEAERRWRLVTGVDTEL